MAPTLEPGDRLLVAPASAVRPGQLVALRDPRGTGRVLVKRVHAVEAAGLDVRGDNPAASTDSRHFGLVAPAAVVGLVFYRYHPPDRSGWIHE